MSLINLPGELIVTVAFINNALSVINCNMLFTFNSLHHMKWGIHYFIENIFLNFLL